MAFECEYCEKELNSKRGLTSHVTQMHPEVREREKKEKIKEAKNKDYTCPYCEEYGNDNLDSLRIHVQKTHDLESPSKQLRIDLFENGEHPTCECGCGKKVEFKSLQKGFGDFIRGHWAKTQEDGFYTEEGLEKAAETRRKQFQEGEREPWNKGMSLEENPENKGLQKLREKNKKENNPERSRKISEALEGRELSEAEMEWNEKLQEINDEYWSKEENREKQRKRRTEYVQKDQTNNPSMLEEEFMEILDFLDLEYETQIEKHGFVWDFLVGGEVVEVHGDFYHVNPEIYEEVKYDTQRQTLKNDRMKQAILRENDENLHIFWENDIKNNRTEVVKELVEIIG